MRREPTGHANRILIALLLLALLLPACTPARPVAAVAPTSTATPPSTQTDTPAPTPTATSSTTRTPTPTGTATPTPMASATDTPAPTATATDTATPTPQPTATPSAAPAPLVIASFPVDGDAGVPPDAPLRLVFSAPVDASMIAAGLRIEPAVAYTVEQPAPAEILIRPAAWSPATDYTVALADPPWQIHFAANDGGRAPLPILMYHRIQELPADASAGVKEWTTSPDTFIAQLDYLAAHGYQPIPLADLHAYLTENRPLPARPIAITFDDGYVDFHDVAWPSLRERGFPAAVSVIVGHVGYGAFLTWEQIAELEAAGVVFGSHTFDHISLKGLDDEALARQVAGSKRELDARLTRPIAWMAYAYGSYDERAIDALRAAGYTLGLTINPANFQIRGDPYRLNRIHAPYDATVEDFGRLLP